VHRRRRRRERGFRAPNASANADAGGVCVIATYRGFVCRIRGMGIFMTSRLRQTSAASVVRRTSVVVVLHDYGTRAVRVYIYMAVCASNKAVVREDCAR